MVYINIGVSCLVFQQSQKARFKIKLWGRHANVNHIGWQFQVLVTVFHRGLRSYELLSQLLIMYSFGISGGRRKKSDILLLDFVQCLFCIERRPAWRNKFLNHVVGSVLVADEHCRSQVFLSSRQFILSGFFVWMHMKLRYTELTSMFIIEVFLDVCVVVQFTVQYFKTGFQIKSGKLLAHMWVILLFSEAPRSALLVCSFSPISLTVYTCISLLWHSNLRMLSR